VVVGGASAMTKPHPRSTGSNENSVPLAAAAVNPNVVGPRRSYGGPRLLVNPAKINASAAGSNSSLNSSTSGCTSGAPSGAPSGRMQVVRPPISLQDRPSFFSSESGGAGTPSPIPGYQSLSPPPRMSALPLAAVPSGMTPTTPTTPTPPAPLAEFRRNSPRYSSLPSHLRSGRMSASPTPNYTQWLPGNTRPEQAPEAGRESPEEGGFLEFSNNNNNNNNPNNKIGNESFSSSSDGSEHPSIHPSATPTPSVSSCSLDVSFTSSMNDSTDTTDPHPHPRRKSPLSLLPALPALIKRTTIGDFKRKLLQHSKSPSNHRVSAVEMLKTTKPSASSASTTASAGPIQLPASPTTTLENLIRRSARVSYIANRLNHHRSSGGGGGASGRFRTDVLSATIVEGRSEEESADSLTPPTTPGGGSAQPSTSTSPPPPRTPPGGLVLRRHLSFKTPTPPPPVGLVGGANGNVSPSSGASTPIETSL